MRGPALPSRVNDHNIRSRLLPKHAHQMIAPPGWQSLVPSFPFRRDLNEIQVLSGIGWRGCLIARNVLGTLFIFFRFYWNYRVNFTHGKNLSVSGSGDLLRKEQLRAKTKALEVESANAEKLRVSTCFGRCQVRLSHCNGIAGQNFMALRRWPGQGRVPARR